MIQFTGPEDRIVRVTDKVIDKVTDRLSDRLSLSTDTNMHLLHNAACSLIRKADLSIENFTKK